MSTGNLALSVKTIRVGDSYVQATHMLNRDLAVPMTPEQHEHRLLQELNFNPPPPKPGFKRCTNCMAEQRVSDDPHKSAFSPHVRNGKPGFHSWCKTCRAEQARRWRQTAPKRDALS